MERMHRTASHAPRREVQGQRQRGGKMPHQRTTIARSAFKWLVGVLVSVKVLTRQNSVRFERGTYCFKGYVYSTTTNAYLLRCCCASHTHDHNEGCGMYCAPAPVIARGLGKCIGAGLVQRETRTIICS